ncbi:YafY family protein [Azospirillum sp. TSO22-1]|uniref:helix-turn-helix transcriptional regulator n=1 Tax=Azospirillum sp. TSO22-1 TaxID=716789 RepID=UPI000D60667B|nr:YafY family protein [Azospirillum sp. TSO22-1]PWC53084.1 DNA-binding protein [Azospirillum sp. TSO22-1]
MARAERLLDLIQILRRHRRPVSGRALADELGVSLRTLYRDIAALQAQGARIDGEAGVGYLLRPGFLMPPLMFTEEEIEALVLGARWVARRGDSQLGAAARSALARIAAVLPPDLRDSLDASALLVGPGEPIAAGDAELASIRQAIRTERKLVIAYRDASDAQTQRTVWPFALGFFDRTRVVAAWCELRRAIRHFRTDRIVALEVSETRYPRRRHALLKAWREETGIAPP